MTEACIRCKKIEKDRRMLYMKCLYDMYELEIPFTQINDEYTLRVCKECRADWMRSIKDWFNNVNPVKNINSGIWTREFGGLKEITQEEWYKKMNNDQEG